MCINIVTSIDLLSSLINDFPNHLHTETFFCVKTTYHR